MFYEAPMPPGVWYEGLSLIFFQSDGLTHFIKNCRAPFTDIEYFTHIVIIIGCCQNTMFRVLVIIYK